MSVLNFIKFLHKKEVLSDEKLLDVIDKTLHSQRSMIKFLMEKAPNQHNQILDLCFHAIEDECDLVTAQRKHACFDKKIFEDLMIQYKKEQKSVSNILLSDGLMKTKDLEALLLEFAQSSTSDVEQMDSSADNEISEAALESLRELAASGSLDPEILAELETEKKKS